LATHHVILMADICSRECRSTCVFHVASTDFHLSGPIAYARCLYLSGQITHSQIWAIYPYPDE